ncbi:malate dehydrogenase [Desulfurivibrio alkaliphilus]|uniref:Malate dehydrogenase n=1 Tax=Desulfurivibrio alkaliphilus (strain DSM 19089 / UNIQEM U267 / AHT2) TaxID=589865 RepID=D6Z269_DESAT|nr:malate dehydrogenase [Desulfurivibrio alkaliphilus]ADH85644.1 malate dehydrogenase, NAD-dependent [Desulfurivibrio alkaliphilus AHT 2]
MRRAKITIIGAGNVGATAAHWALSRNLGDIVLLDVMEGIPQGKALDLLQSGPVDGFSRRVIGSNDYRDSVDSDVVIITAGLARKPGMSRDDLLAKNVEIVKSCAEQAASFSPNAVLIVVTNPIDAMVYTAYKVSGFPRQRVIGMAGVLDSARYRTFLAEALGVAPRDVNAMVMGIHGDNMLPLVRLANVAGVPVSDLLDAETIAGIVKRTQHGGAEIVNHLKTGSAFYTPGLAAVEMAEAIITDSKRVMPCAAWLEGEFGISGCFLGVPVVLGTGGVERIVEFPLQDEERAALAESETIVRGQMAATGI